MFVLAEFKDTIRVKPHAFSKPKVEAIEYEINAKYANKAFHDIGFCICVHDLVEIGDGIVQHSEGSVFYKVKFRMIVFRPFPGEIIVGKIKASAPDGIWVSVGFFDDIFIAKELLPSPREFEESEQVWVWKYQGADLFLDVGERVRLQVQRLEFKEVRPDAAPGPDGGETLVEAPAEVPFKIFGDMKSPGTGPLAWWAQSE
ncbi:DNA-directed RNA polymerase [Allomyces macrogynus ATCC 38327]|uniref:DNA-directed RNA polymerase n=1 Tax=Allomyces macrogynus (strain ATCC 38327) TaxID=578462 RepID=A0A0L0RVH5_ALLM3|nr:DNA-directed RNA polymerase [Allomyces macrogynus ATCC 38327]|eukprot:KNE54442.1 DNA-directed RNA polymerase [Allomyces macrogynus ATCC 38327]